MSGEQPIHGLELANTGSFGFSFVLESNGGGTGSNPKTYTTVTPADFALKGATDDNSAIITPLWPSDPGDFPSPLFQAPPSRQYDAGVSPNNIRLSQVSIDSLTATHGIRPSPAQQSLPSSFGFGKNPVVDPLFPVVGDFKGIRSLTVSFLGRQDGAPPLPVDRILLCNSIILQYPGALNENAPNLSHTFHVTNLGSIQIVSLASVHTIIGVHCELFM